MAFKEPSSSLPPLHKPAICQYLQQELSNLPDHNPPPSNPFKFYPPIYVAASLKVSFFQVFLSFTLYAFLDCSIHATCPAHLSRLDLRFLIKLGEEYNACSSALCNLLHSPVISSLLVPDIFLSTLFWNALNLWDQVSQPYSTTGNIIVLYVLTFSFLESRQVGKIFSSE